MAKLTSPDEFSEYVTRDFTWRLRELSELKLLAISGEFRRQRSYKRALVVMCYAHWEGHAKYCAELFVKYLTDRRIRFCDLTENFYQVRFSKRLLAARDLSFVERLDFISDILNSREERFSKIPEGIIDTKSNLNSFVLKEICLVCGIDADEFESEFDFIDRLLLRRRNEVAHGEAVFVDSVDPDNLVERTSKLMRAFRDRLDNSIALDSFRVPVAA